MSGVALRETLRGSEHRAKEHQARVLVKCGEIKAKANECFRHGDFEGARDAFLEAAEHLQYGVKHHAKVDALEDLFATIASNLALCYIRLDQHMTGLEWCGKGLALRPAHVKLLYRQALCLLDHDNAENNLASSNWKAKTNLETVLEQEPTNNAARALLDRLIRTGVECKPLNTTRTLLDKAHANVRVVFSHFDLDWDGFLDEQEFDNLVELTDLHAIRFIKAVAFHPEELDHLMLKDGLEDHPPFNPRGVDVQTLFEMLVSYESCDSGTMTALHSFVSMTKRWRHTLSPTVRMQGQSTSRIIQQQHESSGCSVPQAIADLIVSFTDHTTMVNVAAGGQVEFHMEFPHYFHEQCERFRARWGSATDSCYVKLIRAFTDQGVGTDVLAFCVFIGSDTFTLGTLNTAQFLSLCGDNQEHKVEMAAHLCVSLLQFFEISPSSMEFLEVSGRLFEPDDARQVVDLVSVILDEEVTFSLDDRPHAKVLATYDGI